jgi:alanine racemase
MGNGLIFGDSALILVSMLSHPGNSNWLEVDRGAIINNLRRMQGLTSVRVMAVVKANGYGHGITQIARVVADAGAFSCGVARIDEALELRRGGVEIPIQVLGYTSSDRFVEAIGNDVTLTIFHPEQAKIIGAAAAQAGRIATVHIKVDTGMSRLGATPEVAFELVRQLSTEDDVFLEGIFTHYACADEPHLPVTEQQEKQFLDLLAELHTAGIRPEIAHAANSAAALTRPSSHFDMVRIGIALYGMNPSPEVLLPGTFKPTLTWKAQLSSIFTLPPGRGVSYGHSYVTKEFERIGVVPVGYGDGYRRVPGNEVLIGGKRTPVVGKVCMDQLMVHLGELPEAAIGDEVVLLGTQGEEEITASELAQKWGTINYEMTCGLSARVPRFYHS